MAAAAGIAGHIDVLCNSAAYLGPAHAAVEATWGTYQRIVSAYRHPDHRAGKTELTAVIKTISHGVPAGLPELSRLGQH